MIRGQTSSGPVNYLLRGAITRQGKANISRVLMLTEGGDLTLWDITKVSGFTATAFPTYARGAAASADDREILTEEVEISVEGAVGEVSYSWLQTGGIDAWDITNPKEAKTRFLAESVPFGEGQTAAFSCLVSDEAGRGATVVVNAAAVNYGDPRGYEPVIIP